MSARVAITGVTLTGNLGGTAMLLSALGQLRKSMAAPRFSLLSIYPDADRRSAELPSDLEIISARPVPLLLVYLPLAVLLWPLRSFSFVRSLARRIRFFDELSQVDAVVDLCGIAFVDGRGLPLLAYNVACVLPALFLGKPVFKLSQAVGPFRRPANRAAARFCLHRCTTVVARGNRSLEYLRELGIDDAVMRPDVTFTLPVPESARETARRLLRERGIVEPPYVLSPSRVVDELCRRRGIDFVGEMAAVVRSLAAKRPVLLLPHSIATGSGKNNDIVVCEAILAAAGPLPNVQLIAGSNDPVLLRAIIGEGALFLGTRFHALVSALATAVPAATIGWSHKYRELLQLFDLEEWTIDYEGFSAERVLALVAKLEAEEPRVRARLAERLPVVVRSATENFSAPTAFLASAPA